MAWSLDTKNIGTYGTTNPCTLNYTCAANTRVLVIVLYTGGSTARAAGTPTYNTTNSFTDSSRGSVGYTGGDDRVELWYLINPPTGSSYSISVPNSTGLSMCISAMSFIESGFNNVMVSGVNSGTGTAANPTINIVTGYNNELVVGACGHAYRNAPTAGANYTIGNSYDAGNWTYADEYDLDGGAAGTIAVNFTNSADSWGVIGIGFRAINSATSSKSAYLKGGIRTKYLPPSLAFPSINLSDDFNRASLGTTNWTIKSGSPSISSNTLSLNGGIVQWNTAYSINAGGIEFYYTVKNLSTTASHTYVDYGLDGWTGNTTYRLTYYAITNTGCNGLQVQYGTYGTSYNSIITTSAQTWADGIIPQVGLRHKINGDIEVFINKGSGWASIGTGNDTRYISTLGKWVIEGNGGGVGGSWIDDFAIGYIGSGNVGGMPAYMSGQAPAGTPASSSKSSYTKGLFSSAYSKSAYLKGAPTNTSTSKSVYLYGGGEILVPDSDVTVGSWKDEDGHSVLYTSLADISNSTYAWYDNAPADTYFEVGLANPSNTVDSDKSELIIWRAYSAGSSVQVKCELIQNTTVIATDTQILTPTVKEYILTLTSPQKANITDYTNLRLRVTVVEVY